MAELATPTLTFAGGCPDCGQRQVRLPDPLPPVGDDFDWLTRDYDGFRLFILQELAARFPERQRWTPADLEVVLVEALSTVLDQLSDMLDRTAAEAYLETARRPESVRRLLALIGYDAPRIAFARRQVATDPSVDHHQAGRELDAYWQSNPYAMEQARRAGPGSVHTQHRMVTVDDHARRLEDHPLVLRAHARGVWTGSWTTIRLTVALWGNLRLDQPAPVELYDAVRNFYQERSLRWPEGSAEGPTDGSSWQDSPPTLRAVLRPYLEAYRMIGQEVMLEDEVPVPVVFSISIRVASNFFQSEVRRVVLEALGTGPGGFFEPGRLRFAEDLHASDVQQVLMTLAGVESVCLNRFKRLGSEFPDQVASGRIVLDGLEMAVCDNNPVSPERGYVRLTLHGGRRG